MSTNGPYAGIKVLDFGQVMAAPYAGMLLADLGADVVKIEGPSGDATRNYTPPDVGGESPYYLFVNRNKRGIAIDLKSEDGRAAILAMVKTADVVIENFRAGAMDRLGIGYETLKESNSRLIYAAVSGYGRNGPFANKAGYDPIAQAESGLMSMCGDPDGPPTRIGISVIDMITGTFATQAISAALYARRDTGAGQYIEANLFATAVNMLGNFGAQSLMVGDNPRRAGSGSQAAQPAGVYPSADGEFMLTIGNEGMYQRFCENVIERPDMAGDTRFATNAQRLVNKLVLTEELNAVFATRSNAEWLERMNAYGIPAGEISSVHGALNSPMAEATNLVAMAPHTTLGELKTMMPSFRLSGTPVRDPIGAPLLGEHTREVLREWAGFEDDRIDAMVASGAAVADPVG